MRRLQVRALPGPPIPRSSGFTSTEFRARLSSIGYPRRFVAADLIISNARIFTGGRSIDGALAIEAGRIVSFGDMDEVRREHEPAHRIDRRRWRSGDPGVYRRPCPPAVGWPQAAQLLSPGRGGPG